MDPLYVTLRLVHVLCGVFWAGTAFFMVSFVDPTVRKLGPTGGQFMMAINTKTRYMLAMPVIALLTILSGTWLFMLMAGGNPEFHRSATAMTLSVGGLASLVAFGVGLAVIKPCTTKLVALAGTIQEAPSPEQQAGMQALQKKLQMGGRSIATLLGVAVVCMAVARYLV